MADESTQGRITRILLTTKDPTIQFGDTDIPALTSLLHTVCNNDSEKFEEACRIVELFIEKALNDA